LSGLRGLAVVRRLARDWGCTTGAQRREPGSQDRTRGFEWPPLAELRERFEKRFGKQTWTNATVTEWTVSGDAVVTKVVRLVEERETAMRVAGGGGAWAWLPKALITTRSLNDGCIEVSLPRSLAEQKGMLAWGDVVSLKVVVP
jgi:hypothetical protein